MGYQTIRVAQADAVATITLDRPDKLNAFTPDMGEELVDAFRAARADEGVRAIILTGEGRGFCAGVDLEVLKAGAAAEQARSKVSASEFLTSFPLELAEFPKPVIAAVNGAAIGVGVTMILPCDIRLAAEGAKLGLTFAKLGILPGLGSSHLLPKLVGRAKALELVLTARVIRAEEAASIGLVNRVVPPDELLSAAREMAGAMAEYDPLVLAHAKQSLGFGESATLAQALENEPRVNASLAAAKRKRGDVPA